MGKTHGCSDFLGFSHGNLSQVRLELLLYIDNRQSGKERNQGAHNQDLHQREAFGM
jgi:hypothetical protein